MARVILHLCCLSSASLLWALASSIQEDSCDVTDASAACTTREVEDQEHGESGAARLEMLQVSVASPTAKSATQIRRHSKALRQQCSVGDDVMCPDGQTSCAGDQCCPGSGSGSVTCPSASQLHVNGCALAKTKDCTTGFDYPSGCPTGTRPKYDFDTEGDTCSGKGYGGSRPYTTCACRNGCTWDNCQGEPTATDKECAKDAGGVWRRGVNNWGASYILCVPICTVTRNAAIYGHNTERLKGQTITTCQQECLARDWCKSFDWHKETNVCDLSDVCAADVGGLKTTYSGNPYDHYDCKCGTDI